MNYKHFIITRFNLRTSHDTWSTDKLGNSVHTNEWLEHRIGLFLKYCFPSVLNQSCKEFTWLIYFDLTTSEQVKQRFRALEKAHSFVKIFWADGYDDFTKRYCSDVTDLCVADHKYVITTRLDNDDIVHKDFVKRIQENFHEQDFIAINFLKLLMLNPEVINKVHIDYTFSNHFISVTEKRGNTPIKGCYSRGDRFWNIKNEIIQITDKPYCLEIISDRNILNSYRGFPVFKKMDLSDFQLEGLHVKNSLADPYIFKIHKMSWGKLLLSLRYCLPKKRFIPT